MLSKDWSCSTIFTDLHSLKLTPYSSFNSCNYLWVCSILQGLYWDALVPKHINLLKKGKKKKQSKLPVRSVLLESSQSRNLDLGIQPSMFVFTPLSRSCFRISCSVLRMLEISARTTQRWTPPSFSLGQHKEGIHWRIHTPVSWLMLLRHQMLEGPLS